MTQIDEMKRGDEAMREIPLTPPSVCQWRLPGLFLS
jgi:hypothetical protein